MALFTFTDNTYGTIASGITSVATSITLTTGHGVRFPAVSGTILPATLINSSNVVEQIHITAHTANSDTLTVTRAANGTSGKAWSAGDRIEVRLTSEFLNIAALLFGSTDAVAAFSLLPSVTTLTIGAGASVALNIGNASAAANLLGGITVAAGKPVGASAAWTPGIAFGGGVTGITYITQAGNYLKIGRLVIASFDIALSAKGSDTGTAQITGLPAGSANTTENPGSFMLGLYANLTGAGTPFGRVDVNATTVTLNYGGSATDGTALTNSQFTATTRLAGTIVYLAGS